MTTGAAVLRFTHLGGDSFWIDEISVTALARDPGFPASLVRRGGPFEPPLSFLAVRLATALGTDGAFETAARVPSAVGGTAEVLLLGLLGWELTRSRRIALVAATLLAVAPFALRLSQDARYYSLFSALVLASWWTATRAWRSPSWGRWCAWGVVVGVAQLTHPFTPLVVAGQVVLGLVAGTRARRPRGWWRQPCAGLAVAIAVASPWYLYGAGRWWADRRSGRRLALNEPGLFDVRVDLDLARRTGEWLLGNAARLTPLVATLAVAIAVGVLAGRGRPGTVARGAVALAVATGLVLVPLARAMGTYFAMRRVGFLLPPLLLAAAVGLEETGARLAHLDRRRARLLARLGVAAITTGVVVLSLRAVAGVYRSERTPYRAFAREVAAAPAGDVVVVGPVPGRWRPLIPRYLAWKGVSRPVRYLPTRASVAARERAVPTGSRRVTWLLPSAGEPAGLRARPLGDPGRAAVVAGDRSWGNVILPWYVARTAADPAIVTERRDRVATLPPFVRLDAPQRGAAVGRA